MLMKRIVAAAVMAVFCGSAAVAQPTATLSGVENAGNFDWTLSFAPDADLFTTTNLGTGGSLATGFNLEVGDGGFSNISVMGDFNETIEGVEIENPGMDPYINDVSIGVTQHTDVASQLGDLVGATVDALFVPLGSTFFTSGGDKAALTFTTTQGTVAYGGLVAQAGAEYTIAADTEMVGTPPSFADFNEDGFVDDLDLAAFFGQWMNTQDSFADFNEDGTVDDLDLAAFFGQWNPSSGSLVAASAVPEPSTLAMVGMGLAGFGLAFRRR